MFSRKKKYLKKFCDNLVDKASKRKLKEAKREYRRKQTKKAGCLLFLFLMIFTSGNKKK